MNSSITFGTIRLIRSTLLILLLCAAGESFSAQLNSGQWDEVVGKDIRNNQGVLLGYVKDTAVDLEHGRYVGMLVSFGGFVGFGEKTVIVPPGALWDDGTPRTLFLNMDEKTFRNAPTFELSKEVGPPQTAKVAEVFRYFGQVPFFATLGGKATLNGVALEPLGYIRKGSTILFLPVENLLGVSLGYVAGLRDLNRVTGKLKGVVIRPYRNVIREQMKIVPPQALRYNLKHNALRLNDQLQGFKDIPSFNMYRNGRFVEENPTIPGVPPPPLSHGEAPKDKAITLKITNLIVEDSTLSVFGRNTEVATNNGKVTLRGREVSAPNRARLLSYATAAAGAGNVTDQIEIRPMSEAEKAIDR